MKKLLSLALVMTLLMGVLAVLPVSAGTSTSLDDHLITHWDFEGDTPLVDKATNGTADTLTITRNIGNIHAGNGILTIPNRVGGVSTYDTISAASSADLLNNTNERTVYIVYRTLNDAAKWQNTTVLSQDGVLSIGNPEVASYSSGAAITINANGTSLTSTSETWKVSNQTWQTVAVSFGSDSTVSYFHNGTNEYTNTTAAVSRSTDAKALYLGNCPWSAMQIEDVRIYDTALTVDEIKSVNANVTSAINESALITHWDFAGDNPLADKATNGVADTLKYATGGHPNVTVENGTAYIKQTGNADANRVAFLYASDSEDLLRTTENRTIYIRYKQNLGSESYERTALVAQHAAALIGMDNEQNYVFRWGVNGTATQLTNLINPPKFTADIWTTVAVSYNKITNSNQTVITIATKQDGGNWTENIAIGKYSSTYWSGTTTETFTNWATSLVTGLSANDLILGHNMNTDLNVWSRNVTFDDVRIYDQALTLSQISAITVSNPPASTDTTNPGQGNGSVVNAGHSLTVADDIGVNFHVAVNESVKAEATVEIVKDEEKLYSGKLTDNPTDANGNYKLSGNVAPKEMGDTVTVTVKDGDGNAVYTNSYSAKEYIEYVIENKKDDTKLVSLVKAMANYGAYAQTLFNYKTDELINSVLPEAERELADVTKEELGGAKVNGANAIDGVKYMGATLLLEENTHIVFSFSVDTSKVTISDANVSESTYVYNAAKGNLQVKSKGLVAKNLTAEQIVTITVDGQELKVAYSPMMYIMNMVDHNDEDVVNIVKALYAYHVAAVAYAG